MDKLTEEQKQRLIETGQAVLNMSHGIKNIAQSLRAGRDVMDQALERDNLDVIKRTWPILKDNLDRVQTLALNMLTFSKDEPLNAEPCLLNSLVESAVQAVHPQAEQQHIDIVLQLDNELKQIKLDAEKMRDAVMNLLLNAIEAVQPQTGYITVQTELDTQHQQAILRIRDNGCGIEDTEAVFIPFYSTKGNAGAGLGLTIAQKVIQKHGGKLTVESQMGQGTVFTIFIPA